MNLVKTLLALFLYITVVHAGGITENPRTQRFLLDASWLYWQPVGAISDYATVTVLTGTHGNVNPLSVDTDYDSGFSLDASYLFDNNVNDVAFMYVNFNQTYQNGLIHVPHGIRTIEVSNPIINSVIYDATKASLNYDYEAYEVNAGYLMHWQQLYIRLLAGVRYIDISSELNAFYSLDSGPIVTHLIGTHTRAIGPTIGAKLRHPIFKEVFFDAMVETGLLAGSMDMISDALNTSGVPFVTALNTINNRHTAIPFYDIKLALHKALNVTQNTQLTLRAGFFGSYYDKVYIRRSSVTSAEEKSIAFYGPFASIGISV